jgi:hypothetical protein|uniref:Uncharacterized protein n=1 Tax=viral metagenome TaxID=1070528 RepID=A0A6C0H0H7_9ZZZZ
MSNQNLILSAIIEIRNKKDNNIIKYSKKEINNKTYKKYYVLTPKNWDQLINKIKQDIV